MNGRDAAALDAVVNISRTLAGEADLAAILELVAKRARALVSARAVALEIRKEGLMVVVTVAGELPEGLVAARENPGSTVLMVPLARRGRAYGVLAAVDRQDGGPDFTVEDEELLEALAALAASALAAEKVGREQRPVALAHVGLAGAIELLADMAESPETEIRTQLDLACERDRAEDRLDQNMEIAIYRVVREALAAIVKCPGASRVLVEVIEDSALEEVRIAVRSFGREETRMDATLPSGQRWRSMLSID